MRTRSQSQLQNKMLTKNELEAVEGLLSLRRNGRSTNCNQCETEKRMYNTSAHKMVTRSKSYVKGNIFDSVRTQLLNDMEDDEDSFTTCTDNTSESQESTGSTHYMTTRSMSRRV